MDLLQTLIEHYDLSDIVNQTAILVLLCVLASRLKLRITVGGKSAYDY